MIRSKLGKGPLAFSRRLLPEGCRSASGPARIYFEPRDAWIGVYVARNAVYICPLPFLVIRIKRGP